MKIILTAVFFTALVAVGITPAAAAPLSRVEESLLTFYAYARTLDAVRVDIERFTVYHKGNRGLWEERIAEDFGVVRLAKAGIVEMDLPEEFQLLRTSFISAAEAYECYVNAFLNSDAREAAKAEELFTRRSERFREKLEAAAAAVIIPSKMAEDFDPLEEEYKSFPDGAGREQFRQAAFLLEEKRFDVALAALTALREKYRGVPAEGPIVLRMVRSVTREQEATITDDQEKAQIALLEELLSSHAYYPNAYDIFVEWRTSYQGFYYGTGGDVEIPNLQYQKMLEGLVATLKQRIDKNPEDAWAREQMWMLVKLPVIERSGIVSGTSGDFPDPD